MSPAKAYLVKKLNERQARAGVKLQRTHSQESLAGREPVMGLPPDPQADLEEAMKEVRAEMEARQRKGVKRAETMPEKDARAM